MATGPIQRVRSIITGVAGSPRYSNLYFQGPDSPDEDLVDAVESMWDAAKARIDDSLTITILGAVTVLDSATGDVIAVGGFSDRTVTSTGTGGALPFATCGLARFRTGEYVGGREIRGRMYLPYPPMADMSGGKPTSSYIDDWQGAFETMNSLDEANGAWCVWSRKHGQNALVKNFDVWNNFAVLRSQRD